MQAHTRIAVFITIFMLSISFASASLTDAQGYYSFDDDDTSGSIAIDSAGNQNGTIVGATTGVAGKILEAYDFDGSADYVRLTDSVGDTNTSGISVGAWINADTLSGNPVIINKEFNLSSSNRAWTLRTVDSSGVIDFTIFNGATSHPTSTTTGYGTGSWVHVVGVFNGSNSQSKIYINGALQNTTSSASTFNDNGEIVHIGKRGTQNDRHWDGKIDEPFIYSYPLTATQVSELYNGGIGYNPYTSGVFTITSIDSYTTNSVNTFNATITYNGTTNNYTTTNGTIITNISIDTGLANVTVTANNYFTNNTQNHNTSGSIQQEITPYTRIELYSIPSDTYINNFTAEYEGNNYTTTNGNASIPLFNETTLITVYSAGLATTSQNLTANPYLENATYYGYTTNTFNITFWNETSNAALDNTTITYQIISSQETRNGTTSNGSIQETLLTPSSYEIIYSKEANRPRSYYVTLTNGSFENIRLYLIDEDISTAYIPRVTDENDRACSENTISLQRYYIDINGYRTVSMTQTDTNGNGLFYVQPNTINYKLYFEGSCGTFTSAPQKIIDNTNSFTVTEGQTFLESSTALQGANINLTYINTTQTYVFDWTDNTNTITQGCLYVYRTKNGQQSTNYTQCTGAASGSLIYTLTGNLTDTQWQAQGILNTNTQYSTYTYTTETINFFTSLDTWGVNGILLGIFGILAIVMLFGTTASGVIVSGTGAIAVLTAFGIIAGSGTMLMAIIVLAIIMLYKMRTI